MEKSYKMQQSFDPLEWDAGIESIGLKITMLVPQVIYNSHYGNGAPAMFTS